MIKMFFKDSLTVDSLQALREYIALKFPNYPAAALTYENALSKVNEPNIPDED